MVKPFSGGEKGDGSGWCGCEYLRGFIREKYADISSKVGGCNRISRLSSQPETVYVYDVSDSRGLGIMDEARGEDE